MFSTLVRIQKAAARGPGGLCLRAVGLRGGVGEFWHLQIRRHQFCRTRGSEAMPPEHEAPPSPILSFAYYEIYERFGGKEKERYVAWQKILHTNSTMQPNAQKHS